MPGSSLSTDHFSLFSGQRVGQDAGRAHTGKVICVGAESQQAAATMGWETAKTMDEALAMAETHIGYKPSITLMHFAPILMADVTGPSESV